MPGRGAAYGAGIGNLAGGAGGLAIGGPIGAGVGSLALGMGGQLIGGLFDSGPEYTPEQQVVIDQLKQTIAGNSPSVAERQLAMSRDRNIAAQMAMAGTARGANVGAARRNAAYVGGQQMQESAGQAAMLRAQEISDARRELAGIGGQMFNAQQAEAQKQYQLAGTVVGGAANTYAQASAEQKQKAREDRFYNQLDKMNGGAAKQQMGSAPSQSASSWENLPGYGNPDAAAAGNPWAGPQAPGLAPAPEGFQYGMPNEIGEANAGLSGYDQGFPSSDFRAKEDVHAGEGDVSRFLEGLGNRALTPDEQEQIARRLGYSREVAPPTPIGEATLGEVGKGISDYGPEATPEEQRKRLDALVALNKLRITRGYKPEMGGLPPPKSFAYKPEMVAQGAPPGPRIGVMAQDLEKTPMGAGMVYEDPTGMKHVDAGQAATASLAVASSLHERLKKLEEKMAKEGKE